MQQHKSTGLIFRQEHFYNWLALSFVAGAVNVGGLMACGRFVTHVTGFASLFGEELALKNPQAAFSMISVPLFFLAGGFISGLLIDLKLMEHRRPHYGLAMGLVTLCIGTAAVGGTLGWFGVWGHELELAQDYVFLAVLSLGSGIQNALVTSASGTVVRTTHLTGITTDLSVGLARVLFGKLNRQQRILEIMSNELRVGSIISFILGSGAGAFGFFKYGYMGFVLPFAVLLYLTVIAKLVWENWLVEHAQEDS